MAVYCYYCGKPVHGGRYCDSCGTDTQPPGDAFYTQEECGDCDEPLPRWANFCPKCGRSFGHYDPSDPLRRQRYNRGQIMGAAFWSLIFLLAAAILSWRGAVPLKFALGGASILVIIVLLVALSRWERGRFRDGTILGHHIEKTTRWERDRDRVDRLGRPLRYEVPVTVYGTTIRWDDGSEEVKKMENCAADHLQLKVGDRIRYLEASRTYRKL